MLNIVKRLLDYNEKQLHKYRGIVAKINDFEDKARELDDADFPKETARMKEEIDGGKKLDDLLPWAFALVREAARRSLGMRHFDVQLIAGIALHEGKIIEQKTGEGKTLTATTALYLNALTGKGAHLVTVNDYLARRDAGWMGYIFDFLGLTTAAMISERSFLFDREYAEEGNADFRLMRLKPASRKEAYEADITYGINSEFGFDYLRDNMAQAPDRMVQRGFQFAIVDEADSVLIDEARTPHIISAPYDEDTAKYYDYARIVKQLEKEDYVLDEKLRTAHLNETGIEKVEKLLGVDNVYEKDFEALFHIEAALKAQVLFHNDKEYIVKDGEVVIVDEFTGRLLQGRRFSEGLHQAIEAKEGVTIKQESRTLATVSLQNYFRMYDKLAGMTGTAATEAEEFAKIYKAEVVTIPTHRGVQRIDRADEIYKTVDAKYNAVADEVARQHKAGRPVLIGTTSIDKNEKLSRLLEQRGIPHELLNAKNHEREAQIIARAGERGAVTVATNMAGRGVDIILGGMQPSDTELDENDFRKAQEEWQDKHDEVIRLGGLMVIGTERHESRRIDNQLRGRSGRQGDPGESLFYVSLEDDLMRIFGGEQISKLMDFFNLPEDQPLSHPMVSRAIEQAQVKVEGFNFDIRKHLVEYDDVLNKQREIIYSLRRKFMLLPEESPEKLQEVVYGRFSEVIAQLSAGYFALKDTFTEGEDDTFVKDFEVLFPGQLPKLREMMLNDEGQEAIEEYLNARARETYQTKNDRIGAEIWTQVVRSLFLSTVDQFWTKHLTAIDDLREGINLRGYAQLDPLVEYKNEAYRLFEGLVTDINFEFSRRVLHVQVEQYGPEANTARATVTGATAPARKIPSGPPAPSQDESENAAGNVDTVSDTSETDNGASTPDPEDTSNTAESETRSADDSDHGSDVSVDAAEDNAEPKMIYRAATATNPYSATDEDVEELVPAQRKKPGRNEPCWCGSGKKYKKCHYPN
jgi:preprotein translocase subunit SecA